MGRLAKFRFRLLQGQKGVSLVETLVAVSILAVIGVVFMNAMYTAYVSVGITDEQQQAEILVRSQIEAIKNTTYADNGIYPVTVSVPSQYSMSISVTPPMHIGTIENNTPLEVLMGGPVTTIQEITVSVSHGNKPVLSVACYKVK